MSRSFRQSMTPLHTWAGLVFGWVLAVVFITGTLSVFSGSISRWMESAGPPAIAPAPLSSDERADAWRAAQAYLEEAAPSAHSWSAVVVGGARPSLEVGWEPDETSFRSARLDVRSGAPLPPAARRSTYGGYHFVLMHVELHAGLAGVWLVGLATAAMLVAVATGIVIHKRIFADFFTFRPHRGQRSWLDAHNAAGVLTLPFQIMIAYTGLAIFYFAYVPAGVLAHYEMPGGVAASFNRDAPYFQALGSAAGRPAPPERTGAAAPVLAFEELVATAEARMPEQVRWLQIEHPGDAAARATAHADILGGRNIRPGERTVVLDATTGVVLDETTSPGAQGAAPATLGVLSSLHQITFGGPLARLLYFVCGIAGCALMTTGLAHFTTKRSRRSENEFGAATPQVYRAIEAVNVVVCAGLAVACAAYLWINRLMPADLAGRAEWEIRLFFLAWAATVPHALLRPPRRAWSEQLAVASGLAAGAPLVSALVNHDHLFAQLARGDYELAGVEFGAIALGLLLALAAWAAGRPPVAAGPQTSATTKVMQ